MNKNAIVESEERLPKDNFVFAGTNTPDYFPVATADAGTSAMFGGAETPSTFEFAEHSQM